MDSEKKEQIRQERKKDIRKTTSIARKINTSFWVKRFSDAVVFDIILIVLIAAVYIWWCHDQIPEGFSRGEKWEFTGNSLANVRYVITVSNGESYYFDMYTFVSYLIYPFIVLFGLEILHLFFAIFNTGEIRRKLKPLNDLAVRAEQFSSISLDNSEQLEHLKDAISAVAPDGKDIKIKTGDKDLQSIEVALNNLLNRMQETQKQQTRFISDASHELRTPISVIQGYVNLLDRWGKEDETVLAESIEALKHESEHMKELIEQLLFLARGDSGRNTLKKADFNLADIMQEVWEESVMIDDKHRYELKTDGAVTMNGDMAMIKQSVRIFVQNAAKYSNEGDTITLSVKYIDGKASYIVQDEGVGMAKSDVIHIFERFYRSDQARSGDTGGSGLGLSIAKWIIDAHDGVIEVLSRLEFGTRFTVTFANTEKSMPIVSNKH